MTILSVLALLLVGVSPLLSSNTQPRRPDFLRSIRLTSMNAQETSSTSPQQTVGIQFFEGVFEPCIPEIRLTRSQDGSSGRAYFTFEKPRVFDSEYLKGTIGAQSQEAIGAMLMIDEEGVMKAIDVSAKFYQGLPTSLLVKYDMRSSEDWERFLRFMDRYAEACGLGFEEKDGGDKGSGGASPRSQSV